MHFDNWFSSVNLLAELEKMGIQCLGTVRLNRLPGCSFISDKEMKHQSRGTVEEKVTSVEGVEIIALKWYDNKPFSKFFCWRLSYLYCAAMGQKREEKYSSSVSECNHDI